MDVLTWITAIYPSFRDLVAQGVNLGIGVSNGWRLGRQELPMVYGSSSLDLEAVVEEEMGIRLLSTLGSQS
jgi:hypothetical protein